MGLAVKLRMIAAVLFCFTAVAAQNLKTFTATLVLFNESYDDILQENAATINNGALQLTPNSAYERRLVGMPHENQVGRAMLRQQFKLSEQVYKYNKTKDRVASFNSSFLFSVCPLGLNTTPGEGLAFIIRGRDSENYWRDSVSFPSKNFGQYLGLTNLDTDGYAGNNLVAVEFDNVKQAFDPDANHVGLNINSIISTVTASLTPLGIELAPDGEARFYNVWVQYDGVSKVIEVYIARQAGLDGEKPSKPDTPVLKSNLDLGEVFEYQNYLSFGFSASTGNNVQLNCIFRWNLTVESFVEEHPPPPPWEKTPKHPSWLKTLLAVGVGVPLLVIGVAVMGYYYPCKKRSMVQFESNILLGALKRLGLVQFKSNILLGALKRLPGTPREFHFKDLKRATNNFDQKNKLGQGGFGVVYRGHLHDENLEVAVKWFSRETINGEDDFLAELTIINRLRHKHLVRLLGWCHKNGKLLLVYDYMPNGSLDAHLFTKTPDRKPLSWDQRYNIISGVASALNYLHNEYDQRVVHRDLKASNIMLDSDFNARLGDFGLARALDEEKTSYSEVEGVAGTLGYIAPECFLTGKATQQSDVYAFGVVLLEIVCGLRPGTRIDEFHFLVDWVWSLHREGRILDAVEERLGDEYVVEEAQKVLVLALACSHPIARERPRTQAIVHIISGLVPVPYVPPFKPAIVWASMPSLKEDDISSLASATEAKSFPTTHLGSGFTMQCISRELYARDNFKSGQARFYNVRVQYDGVDKVIELNCILRWNLTVEYYSEDAPEPEDKHPPRKKDFLLGVGVGVPLLVIGLAVTVYYHLRKKQSMVPLKSDILLGALKRLPETPREFQFKDLKMATNNFDEKNKLGQGGFGVVYRGYLPKENLEVAVKWFSRETIKGQDNFLADLTIINRLRHKHLVRLLGWCHEEGKLLLVYDYMPNGSLDAHLFTRTSDNKPLSWDRHYNIISGVAFALNYLHNECDQRVVHWDLKSSNILLDSYFNA
ncbi:hypothetical protein RHGRI_022534 [Rhododendron griersonianum]|uniref:Protein kinase domain-containing protein n=1 Tax=Rhododendron griersonianum TaxID=479676 RepID=A0AAV6J5I4_9ERIC|nr:hypothetical protein RHGRI_022534 [Rhododendron griersonianum]